MDTIDNAANDKMITNAPARIIRIQKDKRGITGRRTSVSGNFRPEVNKKQRGFVRQSFVPGPTTKAANSAASLRFEVFHPFKVSRERALRNDCQ